ncbi:MAG: hypothetical protein JRN20_20235 [Nitrososphaerota archaeon]|nr:hypothetical protein [Nitrososphaerota archaeon]
MPLSTRRYTELRYTISDYLQRESWSLLFELCGTSDDEQSKAISGILSMYDARRSWKFIDKVLHKPALERRSRRYSLRTVCYILGRIGQSDTRRAIRALRTFLSDDHMLREPVQAALSNLWVLDTKTTSSSLIDWVNHSDDNDDLHEIAVRSCEYLARQEPGKVSKFLKSASKTGRSRTAPKVSDNLIETYLNAHNRRKRSASKK